MSVVVVVPYMQQQKKGGSFIQISSTAAIRPKPRLVWYNASKAAASNATKAMALEYAADNIRFNAVCPQFASTGL
jgi:NAD(P)-dependent dehydrogenase (short-subunit alcohol dehydrogenase family)